MHLTNNSAYKHSWPCSILVTFTYLNLPWYTTEPGWGDIPSITLLDQCSVDHRFVDHLQTLTGQQDKTTRYQALVHHYEGLVTYTRMIKGYKESRVVTVPIPFYIFQIVWVRYTYNAQGSACDRTWWYTIVHNSLVQWNSLLQDCSKIGVHELAVRDVRLPSWRGCKRFADGMANNCSYLAAFLQGFLRTLAMPNLRILTVTVVRTRFSCGVV